jgi:para-aminobenzoate synthetase / 4-amino-4-deoxychorismate lyase
VNAGTDSSDQRKDDLVRIWPDPAAGVFETFLVDDGRAFELDAHLARLASSLEELYGQALPVDAAELVADGAAGLSLGRLRLDVRPDAEGTSTSVRTAEVDPAIVFPDWSGAIELAPFEVPGGIGAHKWADRRLLEQADAASEPAVSLLVDADGTVLEASRSCVFLVVDGALVTPAADGRILPGVTRARVIELARALGIEVREERVPLELLSTADEAFATGAVRGVEPVRGCTGVREWEPGPVTARISSALRRAMLAGTSASRS